MKKLTKTPFLCRMNSAAKKASPMNRAKSRISTRFIGFTILTERFNARGRRAILWLACILLVGCTDFPNPFGAPSSDDPADMPTAASQAVAPEGPTLTPVLAATQTPTVEIPTPTPTIDPNLPDWTVLVYMAADNSLDAASVFNMNQMEAAELGDNVQVIVQWDRAANKPWSDTRRYIIRPDDDDQTINSEILAEIGELNMGDPSVLADFIQWGLANYPANRTSLVVWDHGVGWSGIAEDDTDQDQLTLDELERGLAAGIRDKEAFKFDMIGFDACLMGQLDVYQSLVPYAHAAAASEELTPAAGWPYTQWLNQLANTPDADGKIAAQLATEAFINYYSTEAPTDFVTMAAIDLEQIDGVTQALGDLTAELEQDMALATSLVAPARAGTEIYAKAYGLNAERFGAIDLNHFAAILENQSPNPQISQLAQNVSQAVDNAVLLNDSGRGLPNAAGISLYFPSTAANLDRSYANETTISSWERFLNRYHATTQERVSPPQVAIFQEDAPTDYTGAPIPQNYGQNNPLWLGFQVSGLGLSGVNLLVGQTAIGADGVEQTKLLEVDPLIPEPQRLVDGTEVFKWQDGQHEDFFIWDTRVTYLKDDSGQGQFVILWATTPDGSGDQRTASGILTDASTGQQSEASLVFNTTVRASIQAWAFTPEGTPYEISAQPGDTFTPYDWLLTADGIEPIPGTPLTLNGNSQLTYDWRPVPDGDYKIGFEALNQAGGKNRELVDISVSQSSASTRSFLDPYTGFQFAYPADWYSPDWRGPVLFTSDQDGNTLFQVTIFDQSEGLSAQDIQAQALSTYSGVDVLYEEELEIAGQPAVETAYGYTDADGIEHTGLFYTFVIGDEGVLIDVDGLRENEAQLIETSRSLVATWQYRPVGAGLFPAKWPVVDLEKIAVPSPDDFEQDDRGLWQRFSANGDNSVFIAFNSGASSDRPAGEWIQALADSASDGTVGYEDTATFRIAINDRVWARRDFSFINKSGQEIWGFIMVSEVSPGENDEQIMVWAEAPASLYNRLDQNVFVVMLTQLESK